MSDDIDRAQAREQQIRDAALEAQRRADHGRLPALGVCHYCGEPVPGDRRFCDAECRDAFDYEAGLRRARGVA